MGVEGMFFSAHCSNHDDTAITPSQGTITRITPRGVSPACVHYGAVGRGREKAEELLGREWKERMTREEGADLVKRCLKECSGEEDVEEEEEDFVVDFIG